MEVLICLNVLLQNLEHQWGNYYHNTTDTGHEYDHALQKQKREIRARHQKARVFLLSVVISSSAVLKVFEVSKRRTFFCYSCIEIIQDEHETERKFYLNNNCKNSTCLLSRSKNKI